VWRVTGVRAVVGEGLAGVVRLGVSQGKVSARAAGVGGWRIAGLARNRRYVE